VSRTNRRKAIYFGILGGGLCAFIWASIHFQLSLLQQALLVVLLLVPGRILGFFWKDLLCGLRLLNCKQYEESIRHSTAFLERLTTRPWLKKLIWLGHGVYSRDPEALALNNLGAAELALGRTEVARSHLEASISVDDENPLPFFNLAVLSQAAGQADEAEKWFSEATKRGFSRDAIDKVIMASQSRFAQTDGR